MRASIALPAALVALSTPVILYGLGSYSLVNGDEGIYHYMARHMVETGDWFRVEFNGEERVVDTLTHAPLYLWCKAVVILVLGDSYLSMRLPSACLGILSLLATYWLVDYLANRRAAFLAGLIQLTTFQFVYVHAARTGEMETAISLALTLAVLLFLRAIDSGRSFVAHHLCLIALINLKLPLAVIPVIAEAAYFAIHPTARARLRDWVRTACWMIPIGLAWHGYQAVVHAEEISAVFQELLRLSWGATNVDDLGLTGRVHYYVNQLVFGAYPHVLFYPWAIIAVLAGRQGSDRSGWTLVALNIAAVGIFFASMTLHQRWYLTPAIPLAAAFTGTALERLTRRVPQRVGLVAIAVSAVLTASIRLPIVDLNPFATRAAVNAPAVLWGELGLLVGTTVLLAILAVVIASRVRAIRPIVIAAPLIAALLIVASARVLAPLQFVQHESVTAQLRAQLDLASRAGTAIAYPVVVTENTGISMVRYYFADDFHIRRLPEARRDQGQYFALLEKRGWSELFEQWNAEKE